MDKINFLLRFIGLGNECRKSNYSMMRSFIFLLCCIAIGESSILDDFQGFQTKFNKTYKDDVEVTTCISLFRVINRAHANHNQRGY